MRLVMADLFLTLGPGLTAPIYLFFFNQSKGFTIGGATVLLIFYGSAGLIWAPMWARVARSIGKHRTLQIACACYVVAQTSLMAIQGPQFPITALFMFFAGGTASAFIFLVRAMLADYSDELRLSQGVTRSGLLFSFIGITQKLAASFNTAISFGILAWVGFNPDEHAHNTPQAIFGLDMTYVFAPIVFVAVTGLFFFGYKLDAKRHAEIRAALFSRRSATVRSRPRAWPTDWWATPRCRRRRRRNDQRHESSLHRAAGAPRKARLMSASTTVPAEKPYPLPGIIAFGTVGIPLAGMLLIFGLWTPRF